MTETIGERLKFLRKQHHFTQTQIADYLEFQQGQIAKLENNQRKLKVSSLEKLCELYNVDEDYILDGVEDYSKHDFAFRSNVQNLNLYTISSMNKIIHNIQLLSDLLDEEIIEKEEYHDGYLEITEKAKACRRIWDIDEYTPIDIFRVVLDKLENVTICFLDVEENFSGSSIKTRGQTIIFINSNHPLGRQRFTLAHEIYHIKYDDEFVNCDLDHGNDENEERADMFASALLMSKEALFNYEMTNKIKKWNLDEIIKAEQYFQISHKAMLRKLTETERITEEESSELISDINYNARIRGYDVKLYNPYSHEDNLILGNYIQLINKAYEQGKISESKKKELILESFNNDLLNSNEMDDLIEA